MYGKCSFRFSLKSSTTSLSIHLGKVTLCYFSNIFYYNYARGKKVATPKIKPEYL